MPISLKKRKRAPRAGYGYVWLELPRKLINRIDKDCDAQPVRVSRVQWINAACELALKGPRKNKPRSRREGFMDDADGGAIARGYGG